MKKYENEKEILKMVDAFERAAISEKDWRHAEHLIVALYYLSRHDFETAVTKMRAGIFNLLRAFKVDLTKEMPYHETLTLFWMRTVDEFRRATGGKSLLETSEELVRLYDKDYPLRFYSRERLFSEEARAAFIYPDLSDFSEKPE